MSASTPRYPAGGWPQRLLIPAIIAVLVLGALVTPAVMSYIAVTEAFFEGPLAAWSRLQTIGFGFMAVGAWFPLLLVLLTVALLAPGRYERQLSSAFFAVWAAVVLTAALVTKIIRDAACESDGCVVAAPGGSTVLLSALIPIAVLALTLAAMRHLTRERPWLVPVVGISVTTVSALVGWLIVFV